MYLFDAKSFTNLWYYILWCRLYESEPELFEVETYQEPKGAKRWVIWVWLKGVEEPLGED